MGRSTGGEALRADSSDDVTLLAPKTHVIWKFTSRLNLSLIKAVLARTDNEGKSEAEEGHNLVKAEADNE